MKSFKTFTFAAFLLAIGLVSNACNDKNNTADDLVIPSNYDASNYSANTIAQTAVKLALMNLSNEMKKARTGGVKLDPTNLLELYTASTPTLRSYTNPYYSGKIEGNTGFLNELAKASGGKFVPGTTSGNGGVYGDYLFDENGIELEQMVEKGLYAAALFNHAQGLLVNHFEFTPAKADQLLAVYAASPLFKNSDDAAKHGNDVDRFLAACAARHDKNDGKGLYTQMKTALITVQAAAKANPVNHAKMLQAFDNIHLLWEKINAACVIGNCQKAIATLSASNPNDAQKATALHLINEVIGLLHGWRNLSTDGRLLTDGRIDELLAQLNFPINGTPKPYVFLTDPVKELPKLQQIIAKLSSLYTFTDAETEDLKKNWVKEQSR